VTTSPGAVGVLIVDDQVPFRSAARALVSILDGWQVVGEVDSAEEALVAVSEEPPAVVLMDINLPGMNGIEATRQITVADPTVRVVLLSTYTAEDLPADAMNCGAVAYLRKEDLTPRALRDAVGSTTG
jgi:two-component system, NarL family, invasion response regulator UvrY